MRTLVFGAGNLLLSDEGFGVHFIRHLEATYEFPPEVELFDAGTLGLMAIHKLEEAGRVYVIDAIAAEGPPGQTRRYEKEDFMLRRIPVKLSPHQTGVQEMLLVSELRGACPEQVTLLGIIPACLDPGVTLSPLLEARLPDLAADLVTELRALTGAAIPARIQ